MIKENCLSKDEMIRFLRKELSADQTRAVEEHLQSCEFCREAVDGMEDYMENHSIEALETTLTRLNKEIKIWSEDHAGTPRKPHGNWFFYGMLSLVAIILIVCVYFFFLKTKQGKPVVEPYPALPETFVKPGQDTSIKQVPPQEPKIVKTSPGDKPGIAKDPDRKKEELSKDTVKKKPDIRINSNRDKEDKKEQVWEEPSPPPDLTESPGEIFTVVEEQPEFPGGDDARVEFIINNIRYPQQAVEHGIQGKVFVTFVVETNGTLSDIRVLRGIGGGCDEEAIRVVKAMPKWIPGKQRGRAVKVQYNLPVKFTLP